MKKKIYIVKDNEYREYQDIFTSKKKLLKWFIVSELEGYIEDMGQKMYDNCDEKCHNCKNDLDKIKTSEKFPEIAHLGKIEAYYYCQDCELFYCGNCKLNPFNYCSECNKKLVNQEELLLMFKNKIINNFEKDGYKSLENYYFNCTIEEETLEFSDDE